MAWDGLTEAIKSWQPLVASLIAVIAAFVASVIAWINVSRQISHSANLESRRRSRKHAALRSVLPLALSVVSDYAQQFTLTLYEMSKQYVERALPHHGVAVPNFPALPSSTIEDLTEFIEYSDKLNTELFENLLSRIQILSARGRELIADMRSDSGERVTTLHWLETNIIQAASVYAGVAKAYDYARRRAEQLPIDVSWDDVRQALRNMRLYDSDVPRVFEIVDRLALQTTGPSLG